MSEQAERDPGSKNHAVGETTSAQQPSSQAPPAPSLAGFQRRALRAQAHRLQPVVHLGQNGLTPGVVTATHEALLAHELIKVRMHEPEDKKAMANAVAQASGAALCGLVGHTAILYRPHPKEPVIQLPRR